MPCQDERGAGHLPPRSSLFDPLNASCIVSAITANVFHESHALTFGQFVPLIDYLARVAKDVPVPVICNYEAAFAVKPLDGAD